MLLVDHDGGVAEESPRPLLCSVFIRVCEHSRTGELTAVLREGVFRPRLDGGARSKAV